MELGEEGITVGDVFDKISKRMVSFEMVDKVFKDLTSEGGKFYKMQEIQADTLKGKIANLTDAFDIMFATIGERHEGILKGSVDTIRDLALNYEKVGRLLVSLIATYGAYKTAAIAVKVVEETMLIAGAQRITTTKALGKAIRVLTSESAAYAAIQRIIAGINPYVAVAAALAGISAYFISVNAQANRFKRELEDIASVKFEEADKAADNFRRLADQLKNSTEGSQAYRDAISALNREYGDYLPNLLNEKNALQEILKVENQVVNAIYSRARAYAEEQGMQKIEDKYGKDLAKTSGTIIDMIAKAGYGEAAAREFIKGFREEIKTNNGDWNYIFKTAFNRYFEDGAYESLVKTNSWQRASYDVWKYVDSMKAVQEQYKDLGSTIDALWGIQGYSSDLERKIAEPIEAAFTKSVQGLRNLELSTDEYNARVKSLELDKLNQLKKAFEVLDAVAGAAGKEGSWGNRIKEIQKQIDALKPKDLSWLQKIVNPLVSGDGNRDLKVGEMDQYEDYLDNLRKEYKAVSQSYADANNTYKTLTSDKAKGQAVDDAVLAKAKELNDVYEQRKKTIEDIGRALGVSFSDNVTGSRGGTKRAKSEAQIELETRIDLLKKLHSAYERLSEFMDEDQIPGVLKNLFSASNVGDDMVKNLDFRQQLIQAANDLEKFDAEAAEKLRNYLGYDATSEVIDNLKKLAKAQKEAQDAQERFADFMEGWTIGGELNGEGGAFKISQIVVNYQKALEQIDKKTNEARQKLYDKAKKEKKVGIWSALGFATDYNDITEKGNLAKSNALAKYSEEGRRAIEQLYKDWRGGAMDFNNLSDKTIGQLRTMRDMIEKVSLEEIVSEDEQKNLAKLGLDLEQIEQIINRLKGQDTGDENGKGILGLEISEKTVKTLKYIASEILSCASAIKEYADAVGNSDLGDLMQGISSSATVFESVANGWRQGGGAGAVVGLISGYFQLVMNSVTETSRLEAAISDAANEAERLKAAATLSDGVETLWGNNTIRNLRNVVNLLREYKNLAAADISGADNDFWWGNNFFTQRKKISSLKDLVEGLGYELYDEYGNLNAQGLQAVLDTYDKLSAADRDWIEKAILNAELYKEAMDALNASIQDTWSSLADDMTDKLIEARTEVGDAYVALAGDLQDVFGDLADDIARKLISSFIIDNVLSKYSDDLKDIYMLMGSDAGNDEIASAFATLADSVIADAGMAAEFTNQLYDSFAQAGVDLSKSSDSAGNLSEGIKGITEDTANLLASYLNAIRADVAIGRTQRDTMLGYLDRIASYVATPTLMDHLNKIQANTYDTAVATQGILANLQSVITSENGPSAIRVLS